MARWNPFVKVTYVEGVICEHCGAVYDKVTNRMSEYCDDCGTHLWSVSPNTKTYSVDKNATPCVVKVTSYLGGIVTTAQHEYDIECIP